MKLFTIGYEGDRQPEVIVRLKAAGVKTLADVRAVASSRVAGFSKSLLASSLAEAGIEYVHLRALGTPKPGRDAARAGRIGEMREIYEDHLATPEAEAEYARLRVIAGERPTALLCFEADHEGCHRSVLSERLVQDDGFTVENL